MTKTAQSRSAALPDNAFAKKALEEIDRIDREAEERKMSHIESLKSAKAAIIERVNELNHQLSQLDTAISKITGKNPPERSAGGERRPRRNLEEIRQRVARWMEGRKGQMFSAGDLAREFPTELEGVIMSVFLKPLVDASKVRTDTSAGIRRMKYFVPE